MWRPAGFQDLAGRSRCAFGQHGAFLARMFGSEIVGQDLLTARCPDGDDAGRRWPVPVGGRLSNRHCGVGSSAEPIQISEQAANSKTSCL
jgi:hypothetical protein